MDVLLIAVGRDAVSFAAALSAAGAAVEARTVPAGASRPELDAVLDRLHGRRLVIAADRPGLNGVLSRLLRRGELAGVDTAVLPAEPVEFLDWLGVTAAAAVEPALRAPCRPVGVVKDDSGGLLLDAAELTPWTGRSLWVRAYVDDQRLCDGPVRSLRVRRAGPDRLRAEAVGRWRTRTVVGRAVQLACDEAAIRTDGVERERPRRKRIWWSEPDLWRLAIPADIEPVLEGTGH